MTLTRKIGALALALSSLALLSVVAPPPAAASPSAATATGSSSASLLQCAVVAGRPTFGNYEVVGYGGTTAPCGSDPTYFASEVCLDYNFVTIATSCVTHPAGASRPTNAVSCLPGVWATDVTPIGAFGPLDSSVHSQPLIITTQLGCIDPD